MLGEKQSPQVQGRLPAIPFSCERVHQAFALALAAVVVAPLAAPLSYSPWLPERGVHGNHLKDQQPPWRGSLTQEESFNLNITARTHIHTGDNEEENCESLTAWKGN